MKSAIDALIAPQQSRLLDLLVEQDSDLLGYEGDCDCLGPETVPLTITIFCDLATGVLVSGDLSHGHVKLASTGNRWQCNSFNIQLITLTFPQPILISNMVVTGTITHNYTTGMTQLPLPSSFTAGSDLNLHNQSNNQFAIEFDWTAAP